MFNTIVLKYPLLLFDDHNARIVLEYLCCLLIIMFVCGVLASEMKFWMSHLSTILSSIHNKAKQLSCIYARMVGTGLCPPFFITLCTELLWWKMLRTRCILTKSYGCNVLFYQCSGGLVKIILKWNEIYSKCFGNWRQNWGHMPIFR